jgi:hypothetical protein
MRRIERPHQKPLRMSDDELSLLEQLSARFGIDGSSVLRQALHRWAMEEKLTPAEPQRKPKK